MKLYLVWNTAKNECVGFFDEADAIYTSTGKFPKGKETMFLPLLGEQFREMYAEEVDILPMSEVEV